MLAVYFVNFYQTTWRQIPEDLGCRRDSLRSQTRWEEHPTFRRNMSPASSELKSKASRRSAEPVSCFMLVTCLAYSPTLKIEATCSSETSVEFKRHTRRYIPEDITHNFQEVTIL
jgi:hypothetical protein